MQVTCLISVSFLQVCLHVAGCHGHSTVSMGGAPGTKKGLLPLHPWAPTCLPASLAAAGNPQPLTAKKRKSKYAQMLLLHLLDMQVCVCFLQIGRVCTQFPFMLSFAPLNI